MEINKDSTKEELLLKMIKIQEETIRIMKMQLNPHIFVPEGTKLEEVSRKYFFGPTCWTSTK